MAGLIEMKTNPLKSSKDFKLDATNAQSVFKTDWALYGHQIFIVQDTKSTPAAKQEEKNRVNEFFNHLNNVLNKMMNATASKTEVPSETSGNTK